MVLRLHGYGAWIESDGKPLEEYAVEVKDNVISCYVCSEEGKAFVLHFDDDGSHCSENHSSPHDHGRSLDIEMDGSLVTREWCSFMGKGKSEGVRVGDLLRPYIFTPVDTTDDDTTIRDVNNEQIGTIRVELMRSAKLSDSTDYCNGVEPRTGAVHERSKKAGSHRVALGEAVRGTRGHGVRVMDIDHTPLLTFRFLYRKRDILKAHGIIPQSPIPSPPPEDSPGPTAEGMESDGKGVKRKREETGNDDVIEIFSDEEDLDLQGRIPRKRAKKSVKQEAVPDADDVIDLT